MTRATRRGAIAAGLSLLLAGCQETTNREIRDDFDLATQYSRFNVSVGAPENVTDGHYIEGNVTVENGRQKSDKAKLIIEVRRIGDDGTMYREVADEVRVPANGTTQVQYNVSHLGPGTYIVSVAGFAPDETVNVANTSATRMDKVKVNIGTDEEKNSTDEPSDAP